MERLFEENEVASVATGAVNEQLIPEMLGDSVAALVATKEPLPEDPFASIETKKKPSWRKILQNRGIQISPVGLCFGLAGGVTIPVSTELFKDRVCEIVLGFSDVTCATIGQNPNKTAQDLVRSHSANYMLINLLISSLPCVFFSLFLGPWSDKYGRKIPMMMTFIGMMIASASYIVFTYYETHPAFLLISPAVAGLFGGWTIFLMSSYSYIGDYTNERNRALVISVFSGFLGMGISLGQLLGTTLLQEFGFSVPFYVVTGIHFATFLYILFVAKDHDEFQKSLEASGREKWTGICNIKSVTDNCAMIRSERPNGGKVLIWIMLTGYTAAIMCLETEGTIMQLFVEFRPLSWTVSEYGHFAFVQGIVNCVFLTIAIPVLKKVLELSDTTIGIIGSVSGIACAYAYAISIKTWMVYAALGAGVLRQLIYVCLQSTLIGLVRRDEVGKIMSVVGIIQSVSMILSATGFVKLFGATAAWWPGLVFAVESFFLVVPLASFCYVDLIKRRYPTSTDLE